MERKKINWLEKYRPEFLKDILCPKEHIQILQSYVDRNIFPNLLLYGPPGTGKTSTALALIREVYGKDSPKMLLKLNGSDERTMEIIRGLVTNFIDNQVVGMPKKTTQCQVKFIFFDEADALTKLTQNALRRMMEKYARRICFILVCNVKENLIPAIHSRCDSYLFSPLQQEQVKKRLTEIAEKEQIQVSLNELQDIYKVTHKDMRRGIHLLQKMHQQRSEKKKKNVYQLAQEPHPNDVEYLYETLKNPKTTLLVGFTKCKNYLDQNGIPFSRFLNRLTHFIYQDQKLCGNEKNFFFIQFSGIERQQAGIGKVTCLQLSAFVSIFKLYKKNQLEKD